MSAARAVVHLRRRDARRIPWRNGRGVTEELALWPASADFERLDFDWRVSRSRVGVAGPFSPFPGYERILLVVAGEGLVLSHGAEAPRARLRRLEPYRFSGDWPTEAELARGEVSDFNVIFRRERCEATAEALALGRRGLREELQPGHAFLHVLSGSATARVTAEEEPIALADGDSLWMRELARAEELDLRGESADCALVLVRIAPTATSRSSPARSPAAT